MQGLLDPAVPPATVAGLDLVRDADGELRVLEDNLRMPSGPTYALAVREAVEPELGAETAAAAAGRLRRRARRGDPRRRPRRPRRPGAAILSDGPESGAWYEHQRLGRELGIPVVEPGQLEVERGRLFARHRPPAAAARRPLPPHRRGPPQRPGRRPDRARRAAAAGAASRAGCAASTPSAPASPTTSSPTPTPRRWSASTSARSRCCARCRASTSPTRGAREAAMGRLEELVVKPRDGFGGQGVTIMPRATAAERRRAIGLLRRRPERFVAQETVELSSHPTVCGERLGRAGSTSAPTSSAAPPGASAMAGGLTRYARGAGEMVVNSSRGGGCKDTWVVRPEAAMKRRSLASRHERPLIGVTTSEVRPAERVTPLPEGEPRGREMALGLPYLQGIEAAGGLPLVMPPLPEDGDRAAARPPRRHLPLRRPRPRPGSATAPSRTPSSGRPSPTSTASSSRSPAAPTPARCRSWRSAAAPRRSTSSAAAPSTSTCPTSRRRSPTARAPPATSPATRSRWSPAAAWRRRWAAPRAR